MAYRSIPGTILRTGVLFPCVNLSYRDG